MDKTYSSAEVADILSVSKRTQAQWRKSGFLEPALSDGLYEEAQLLQFDAVREMLESDWEAEAERSVSCAPAFWHQLSDEESCICSIRSKKRLQ